MKVQRSRSVGFVALSCSMVLLAAKLAPISGYRTHTERCVTLFLGDGDCDDANNNGDCGYDLGDCCEESCADNIYVCGENRFNCIDPDYLEDDDPQQSSYSFDFGPCDDDLVGNGYCNTEFNTKECGYDGGDCCSCTCADCGGQDGDTCIDPTEPCLDGYAEAGTLTTVTAGANGFLASPGAKYGGKGCMLTGCKPKLTRDGDVDDEESRWSCHSDIFADGGPCEITYYFGEAKDIEYLQVAFFNADEHPCTLQVTANGVHVGEIQSSTESTYVALPLHGYSVDTLSLATSDAGDAEWVHLLEVRFLVPDRHSDGGRNY